MAPGLAAARPWLQVALLEKHQPSVRAGDVSSLYQSFHLLLPSLSILCFLSFRYHIHYHFSRPKTTDCSVYNSTNQSRAETTTFCSD
jgi:hypothetical protein